MTITTNPDVMGGVPCLRGLRIPVATVFAMAASGMTSDEILADLPDLTAADIAETVGYPAQTARDGRVPG